MTASNQPHSNAKQHFSVGQTLWFVPHDKRQQAKEITIEKVGRKYLTAGRIQIDIETFTVSNDFNNGIVYFSKAVWDNEQEKLLLKGRIERILQPNWKGGNFDNLSLDQIKQAYKALSTSPIPDEL